MHPFRGPLTLALVAGLLLAGLLAAPAAAHVTANPGQAPAGGFAVVDFRVPHGCEESSTTQVAVQIPEGVVSVTPEFVPGWTVETTTGELDEPVELHGETVTEHTEQVTFTGGEPIPDGRFFEFGISMRLPDEPGETLYFPVVQTCEEGETRWIQIPAEGESGEELDEPAPTVTLAATIPQPAAAGIQDTDPLVWVALIVGIAGLLVGAGTLGVVRRRS